MTHQMATITDLQEYSQTKFAKSSLAANASVRDVDQRSNEGSRPISELYPGLEDSSLLNQAQRMASEALGICDNALVLIREDDLVQADIEIMRLVPIATELFCCRAIGEGFANLADTLLTSLTMLEGDTLNVQQLIAIRSGFEELYDSPGLSFDDSLGLSDRLEAANLRTSSDLAGLVGDA